MAPRLGLQDTAVGAERQEQGVAVFGRAAGLAGLARQVQMHHLEVIGNVGLGWVHETVRALTRKA